MDPIRTARINPDARADPLHEESSFGELAGRMGEEIAGPLSAALERVVALGSSGNLDIDALNALREDIERARRVGIMVQQLGRFAGGQVRQIAEPLDLTQMLRDALRQRHRETEARGIQIRQLLRPSRISADASLVFSLLQTLLDWCFEHSRSRIEFRIEQRAWPTQIRLLAHFDWRDADTIDTTAQAEFEQRGEVGSGPLDSVAWRLLVQTVSTLGLQIERDLSAWQATVEIEFPPMATRHAPPLEDEADDDEAAADSHLPVHSRPPVGSHVLVVASRREMRNLAHEALRRLGLMLDFASSTEEAREFCSHALPHAIVYEGSLGGFEVLRKRLLAELPSLVFVRLAEEGHALEVTRIGGEEITTVGRDAIIASLPAALSYGLGRVV